VSTNRAALLSVALAIVACGAQPPPRSEVGGEPASSAGTPPVYAVFATHDLVIDRLESPIPLAMTAGSSARLVTSANPDIVSVVADNLVAHRNGRAELRSPSDRQPLVVTVSVAGALRLEPASITLRAGATIPLRVLADGNELPLTAAKWSFTDPEIAVVEAGRVVRAGYKPGKATVTATYGDLQASALVEVRPADAPFRVIARNRNLRRGSVEQLMADAPSGAQVVWSSSDGKVLIPLRGGLFQAGTRGSADACAFAAGRQTCVKLFVR